MDAQEYIKKFGVHYYDGDLYNKDDEVVCIERETLEDLACPQCGDRDHLRVVTETWAEIGCDSHICQCDCDYDSDAFTNCTHCGEDGTFREFKIEGLDNALQEILDNGDDEEEDDDEEDSTPETTTKEDPPPPPAVTIDELSPPPEPQSEPIGWDTDGINNQQTNT